MAHKKRSKQAHHERVISRAKQEIRPTLDIVGGWRRFDYAHTTLPPVIESELDRVDGRDMDAKLFRKRYIKPAKPCVISGLMDKWPAMQVWNKEVLLKSHRSALFKVGESDTGKSVRIKLKHFYRYVDGEGRRDDSPLYIFDDQFKLKDGSRSLFGDYEVPGYFRDDLFELISDRRRPPYRWVVIGPERSGTGLHVDPLGTSAWNAVVSGSKRWVLFPPRVSKSLLVRPGCSEGIAWFHNVWARMTPDRKRELGAIEFVQRAGEVVYVPGGWFHAVINLELTTAVTHNFAPSQQAEFIWLRTRNARPRMAQHLLRVVDQLAESDRDFKRIAKKIRRLQTVPALLESSSSSSSSWSSSDVIISDTSSESDSNGVCNCASCKRKRKRSKKRLALGKVKPPFRLYG
jgi:histone arginine demethylase JMJD6